MSIIRKNFYTLFMNLYLLYAGSLDARNLSIAVKPDIVTIDNVHILSEQARACIRAEKCRNLNDI